MTPGLAGLAGTPKRRVSFVLIFRSYDLEELEAAVRWLRASASRTLVCSREVPRGSEAARPLPACPLTCTQARERELQMAKASAGHGPAAPAGEAVASCATAPSRGRMGAGRGPRHPCGGSVAAVAARAASAPEGLTAQSRRLPSRRGPTAARPGSAPSAAGPRLSPLLSVSQRRPYLPVTGPSCTGVENLFISAHLRPNLG